ncbi:MAG: hypothetical protein WDA08_06500 [Weeksellaceae bacterium]
MTLNSCQITGESKSKNDDSQVLQDNQSKIKSTRTSNLVEALYKELTEKNTELQQLESALVNYEETEKDSLKTYKKYNAKSDSYYQSALVKIDVIQDSILKNQMNELINSSKSAYKNKTADLDALLEQIKTNNTSLKDYHEMLKIALTLPVIEKFQNENFPDDSSIENLIREQSDLIEEIKNLMPDK